MTRGEFLEALLKCRNGTGGSATWFEIIDAFDAAVGAIESAANLRKERQMEGIAKAKAAGVYKGRPASIDPAQIADLKAQGFGPSQIARKLGIGRASVYRALEA